MAVVHDYKCDKHGYFESRKPECPMKGCTADVHMVILQAPSLISAKTKFTDKSTKQLAMEFDMSDIKTTREGENQAGYLMRKNKFTEKEYADAEKFATRKKGVNKDKLAPVPPPQAQEPRAGDAAIWGGGFQGLNMQAILAGRAVQSVQGESVGLTPKEAGINSGPQTASYFADPDNLKIKTWEYQVITKTERTFT